MTDKFSTGGDRLAYVYDKNRARRHPTASQLAVTAVEYQEHLQQLMGDCKIAVAPTTKEVAKKHGVSERTVYSAKKLDNKGRQSVKARKPTLLDELRKKGNGAKAPKATQAHQERTKRYREEIEQKRAEKIAEGAPGHS